MAYLKRLNRLQFEAATHGTGPLLILAGAGSGKTSVLTARIAHLVLKRGVEPSGVLAVTFTNKAAGEIRERLKELIGDKVKELTVGTFHTLGLKILREEAKAGTFPVPTIYDEEEQTLLTRLVMSELSIDDRETPFKSVVYEINLAKNDNLSPQEYAKRADDGFSRLVATIYERYQKKDFSAASISDKFAAGLHAMRRYFPSFPHLRAVKGQIVGPVTLAGNLKDSQGVAAFHDPTVFDAIIKHLSMKARWQIDFLSGFKVPVILFVDEPYLSCLGAAFATIEKDSVIKSLREIFDNIKDSGATPGIHCCGNTDWSMVLESGVDILSFDAFFFMDKVLGYSQDLKDFLERGGVLSWGIVPTTSEALKDVTLEVLMKKMEGGIKQLSQKGMARELVLERSILTPSYGTGTLTIAESEKAMDLNYQLSLRLKERYGL